MTDIKGLPITLTTEVYKEAEYIVLTEVIQTDNNKSVPRVLFMLKTDIINDDVKIFATEMLPDHYYVSISMNDSIIVTSPLLVIPNTSSLYFKQGGDFIEILITRVSQ